MSQEGGEFIESACAIANAGNVSEIDLSDSTFSDSSKPADTEAADLSKIDSNEVLGADSNVPVDAKAPDMSQMDSNEVQGGLKAADVFQMDSNEVQGGLKAADVFQMDSNEVQGGLKAADVFQMDSNKVHVGDSTEPADAEETNMNQLMDSCLAYWSGDAAANGSAYQEEKLLSPSVSISATKSNATGGSMAANSSILEAVQSGNLVQLIVTLDNPDCPINDRDIEDAMRKAVSMDWAVAIAQLLPLLPSDRLLNLLRDSVSRGSFSAARVIIEGTRSAGCRQLGETDLILAVQPGATVPFAAQFVATSDVNGQDLHGRTALSYAAQHGLPALVRFLTREAGANRGIRDTQDWVPLQYAYMSLDTAENAVRAALGDVIEILSPQ